MDGYRIVIETVTPLIIARPGLAIAAAFLLVSACSDGAGTPEEALRAWVDSAEAAAEQKDRAALLAKISPDYADARGNDRAAVDRILRVMFLRLQKIALLTKLDSVDVYNDSAAEISLTVGMAGTNGGVLGLDADAYRFELDLVADGDEWLLTAARWGELGKELK